MKYSLITGFLGELKDRFTSYQPHRSLVEKFEVASKIKGLKGLELIYPQDFADLDLVERLLDEYNFEVSAINLNIKGEAKWRYGGFTAVKEETRKEAIEYLKKSMDIAERLGANLVTVCPLNDGSDYPFEIDYKTAWENTVSCIKECAGYNPSVKISIEYKTCEPRMHVLIRDAGRAALLAKVIDRENVGVTLDVGHSFEAGEIPAESVAILASVNKLFYVHINDNYRNWDWDMIPGIVNTLEIVEFIYNLKLVGYDSWLTIDVFPWRFDPVKVFTETIEWMEHCRKLSEKIDYETLKDLQKTADAVEVLRYIRSIL